MKKTWVIVTLVGGLVIIPSLIATIAIGIATGEPCETSDGGQGTCSSDPKLLYGMVPLFVGGAMFGIGLWRWIATSSKERSSRPAGQRGGLFGSLENWRDSTVNSVMAQYNVPGASGAAPPSGAPPPASPAPAAPPTDLASATGAPPSSPPPPEDG